jgi:hypothetical protein
LHMVMRVAQSERARLSPPQPAPANATQENHRP